MEDTGSNWREKTSLLLRCTSSTHAQGSSVNETCSTVTLCWRGGRGEEVCLSQLVWIRSHFDSKSGSVDIQTEELRSSPHLFSLTVVVALQACHISGNELQQRLPPPPASPEGGKTPCAGPCTLHPELSSSAPLCVLLHCGMMKGWRAAGGADREEPSVPH